MATVDNNALAEGRQSVAADNVTVDYSKTLINAAFQAIEDWFEANRASLITAIDDATSPVTLSNPRKKRLVAAYLEYKTGKEMT